MTPGPANHEHPWGVRKIGIKNSVDVEYLPWCECGWEGYLVRSDNEACAIAYHHATGRNPEEPEKRAGRAKTLQGEALFDREEYR